MFYLFISLCFTCLYQTASATRIFVEMLLSKAILPSFNLQTTAPPPEDSTVIIPFWVIPKLSRCFFVFRRSVPEVS